MSLGGGPPSPAEEDAIRDAIERGTLCICSAGNSNGPIEYPGAYPECAAVSAVGLVT
jgi:subtilisin family serine protease